jgi:hypothetical protein
LNRRSFWTSNCFARWIVIFKASAEEVTHLLLPIVDEELAIGRIYDVTVTLAGFLLDIFDSLDYAVQLDRALVQGVVLLIVKIIEVFQYFTNRQTFMFTIFLFSILKTTLHELLPCRIEFLEKKNF